MKWSNRLAQVCVGFRKNLLLESCFLIKAFLMAERFVEVDRNTPMLLPADLRDWVPEDDLVHFVIEALRTLPTGQLMVNERGTG